MDQKLYCNLCWDEIAGHVVYITKCSHIFCREDAERYLAKELMCPMCETPLGTRHSIHEVDLRSIERKIIGLCGVPPETILQIAEKAIGFWNYQQQTMAQHEEAKVQKDLDDIRVKETQLRTQLIETQNKVNLLTNENGTLKLELTRSVKDLADIQEKYAEKVRQKRKLEELYQNVVRRDGGAGRPPSSSSSSSSSGQSEADHEDDYARSVRSRNHNSPATPTSISRLMATQAAAPRSAPILPSSAGRTGRLLFPSTPTSTLSRPSSASSSSSSSEASRSFQQPSRPSSGGRYQDTSKSNHSPAKGRSQSGIEGSLGRGVDRFAALRANSPQITKRSDPVDQSDQMIYRMTPVEAGPGFGSKSTSLSGRDLNQAETHFALPKRPATPTLSRMNYFK